MWVVHRHNRTRASGKLMNEQKIVKGIFLTKQTQTRSRLSTVLGLSKEVDRSRGVESECAHCRWPGDKSIQFSPRWKFHDKKGRLHEPNFGVVRWQAQN